MVIGQRKAVDLGSHWPGHRLTLTLWRQTGWSIIPMRPFLQRVFVVLWLLWALVLVGFLIVQFQNPRIPFSVILQFGAATAAGTAIPVMLLQYLVLGFFSPLRLFASKAPPA